MAHINRDSHSISSLFSSGNTEKNQLRDPQDILFSRLTRPQELKIRSNSFSPSIGTVEIKQVIRGEINRIPCSIEVKQTILLVVGSQGEIFSAMGFTSFKLIMNSNPIQRAVNIDSFEEDRSTQQKPQTSRSESSPKKPDDNTSSYRSPPSSNKTEEVRPSTKERSTPQQQKEQFRASYENWRQYTNQDSYNRSDKSGPKASRPEQPNAAPAPTPLSTEDAIRERYILNPNVDVKQVAKDLTSMQRSKALLAFHPDKYLDNDTKEKLEKKYGIKSQEELGELFKFVNAYYSKDPQVVAQVKELTK